MGNLEVVLSGRNLSGVRALWQPCGRRFAQPEGRRRIQIRRAQNGWGERIRTSNVAVSAVAPRVGDRAYGHHLSADRLSPSPSSYRPPSAPHGCSYSVEARRLYRMTRLDPLTAGVDAKRTAMLLREARAVLRRLDILAAVAIAADDPAVLLIAEARETVERLVIQLGRRGQVQQRRAREAVRRIR
jgi:hypothetical protein